MQESGVEYPIGAVAIVPNARSVFYLTAIARLDKSNNAHATREDICSALNALIDTYDKEGQGLDIFIPLIGTGESRAEVPACPLGRLENVSSHSRQTDFFASERQLPVLSELHGLVP